MDFSAICRTCLGSDSLNPIFANSVDHKPYSTAIFVTMGVKVDKDDGLPQQMCAHCIYYLNNSLAFRKQCKDAEAKLMQIKTEPYDSDLDIKIVKAIDDVETNDDVKDNLKCERMDIHTVDRLDSDSNSQEDIADETKPTITEDTPAKRLKKHRAKKKKTQIRIHCMLCNKDLSVKSLDTHMMHKHPGTDERRDKCTLCDRYIVREKMNRHVMMMHAQKTYQCEHCNSVCNTRKSLVDHIASCVKRRKKKTISRKAKGSEMTECEVCHKRMQRASLKTHVNVKHAGLGPVCEHCGRRFGNKLRLGEHLRAKHGYEKFKCSACEFSSASSVALANHERRHRGEKPFVCEACGAKFHAAYLLAQHRRSHTTEKTVQCASCPAAFKTGNGLSAHARAAHGTERVRCPRCARAFSCRHYAVKHLRSVHLFKGPIPPLQVIPGPNEL